MRQILIDHARKRAATGRARDVREHMQTRIGVDDQDPIDLIALDDALTRLGDLDEQQARFVELRFFGGLTVAEVADVLEVSCSTAERLWRRVKAWLLVELRAENA